jgi:hypothetical protein
MSAPFAEGPTPTIEQLWQDHGMLSLQQYEALRRLERRCRAAEALLKQYLDATEYTGFLVAPMKKHLESAKEMDQ